MEKGLLVKIVFVAKCGIDCSPVCVWASQKECRTFCTKMHTVCDAPRVPIGERVLCGWRMRSSRLLVRIPCLSTDSTSSACIGLLCDPLLCCRSVRAIKSTPWVQSHQAVVRLPKSSSTQEGCFRGTTTRLLGLGLLQRYPRRSCDRCTCAGFD